MQQQKILEAEKKSTLKLLGIDYFHYCAFNVAVSFKRIASCLELLTKMPKFIALLNSCVLYAFC